MAPVHRGTSDRNSERSDGDVEGKRKRRRKRRRRRRRSEGSSSLEKQDGSPAERKQVGGERGGARAAWAVRPKGAVEQLNELRPGVRYRVTAETGPLHAPEFSVGVALDGFLFQGRGRSKKQAKARAAAAALRSFVQFPNTSQAHAAIGGVAGAPTDFTADGESEPARCGAVFSSAYRRRRLVRLTLLPLGAAGPVVLLNRLRPGLRFGCLAEKLPGRPARRFVTALSLEGRVFEGCGHSKRLAKAKAAAAALHAIYNVSLGPGLSGLHGNRAKQQLPQFFAESIFHLVTEKFRELTDGSSTSPTRHKVLAGIVMTRGFDLGSAQVVSLATGTKVVPSGAVSDGGAALSDLHAEVISRRALVHFLFAQLELLLSQPAAAERSVLVPDGGGGFRLRGGVLFHMYVSRSPCGDARLSCPYESTASLHAPDPSRRFRCRLRVKVGGAEGTLPVAAATANQSRGAAASMSCTDKTAKWSVVGLQGALLSHLVEPVYLHSLTVASLSHPGHLGRALARRLAPVRHLPRPYRRQPLLLGCLSGAERRPGGTAPSVSLNWSGADGGLEEVSTATGRTGSGAPSRLCSRFLFARWQKLQQQLNREEATPTTYSGSKMAAGRYQRAMQQFTSALQVGGLGTWLRKPAEPSV